MERIGSIWTMIVRYLLLVMLGGGIVWACNSAGISVYADDGETPDGAELIRFGLFRFRSPLLTKSMFLSLPPAT